jgi:nicotinate dehydrogenase subunit B
MARAAKTGSKRRDRDRQRARYVNYELVRTYVGVVAEVEVKRKTGGFYVAHDCGQIINPDGLCNQIEGCIVQTVK